MGLSSPLLLLAVISMSQQPPREMYQDFRGGRLVSAPLTLFPEKTEEVIKPEKEGLRVTLPKDGNQTWGWGVAADFPLSGDFEITGTYEWLTVEPPTLKSKVGVALQLAPNEQRPKWAQVSRLQSPQGGVYSVEYWDHAIPNSYHLHSRPTEARTGQLRLVREGSKMTYWTREGLEKPFEKIHEGEFGKDDLEFVRFVAVNNKNTTTVDVRLLDLRIRSASVPATAAIDQAALPATSGGQGTSSNTWIVVLGLIGVVLTLAIVTALGFWMYERQHRRAGQLAVEVTEGETTAPLPPVLFTCAACGKPLKARGELAGKKVKCTQCGEPVPVPQSIAELS
jgi:hypothetical protein